MKNDFGGACTYRMAGTILENPTYTKREYKTKKYPRKALCGITCTVTCTVPRLPRRHQKHLCGRQGSTKEVARDARDARDEIYSSARERSGRAHFGRRGRVVAFHTVTAIGIFFFKTRYPRRGFEKNGTFRSSRQHAAPDVGRASWVERLGRGGREIHRNHQEARIVGFPREVSRTDAPLART